MAVIHIESIKQAISQGTLIELAADYRTSRTIRACLPRQTSYPFAISTTAFREEIQPGTALDRQSRLEAIGAFLRKVLGFCEQPSPAVLEFKLPGEVGRPVPRSLKLEWFALDKYWVILLPHEQIQPDLKPA